MIKYSPVQIFSALSSPIRLTIIERLAKEGTLTLGELAHPLHISLPAVLKHAIILENCGLVIRSKYGRVHYCTINKKALEEVQTWIVEILDEWSQTLKKLQSTN
ncbi:MAG: transcriptional regulator [Parcubacteria group bacterium]|nr:transcriptional regulator [Parcubacteria group bacterium]